jgi:hypothetical protein
MGGLSSALLAFIVALLTFVVLIFLLALAIATAQHGVIAFARARTHDVKRWGGWILLAVGIWFLILSFFAEWFVGLFPV